MSTACTRRQLLCGAAAGLAGGVFGRAQTAPTARVAIAKCATYGSEMTSVLSKMFDQLGGLGRLVKGKTVAIKINMVGQIYYRVGHLPPEDTYWSHPAMIGAVAHLMARAGARRIRILEGVWSSADPLEEFMLQANWEPRTILSAAPGVEFENTNCLGSGKKYSRFPVPGGGYIFPAYDLNHSYENCDVFVSMTKMKQHATAGVTLSMKNCFGATPISIYGEGAGEDEPNENPVGGRGPMHSGHKPPPKSAPQENDPSSPRSGGYRIPRIVADIVAARPVDLAIIDGIKTIAGGEGAWNRGVQPVSPGVIIAGTNCVSTDTVAMRVMGFDPMAKRGTPPFDVGGPGGGCDNSLELAEKLGVGSRDMNRIEIAGVPISEAVFNFSAHSRRSRRAG
jgi:uncharacterized protein (DUF362 family)